MEKCGSVTIIKFKCGYSGEDSRNIKDQVLLFLITSSPVCDKYLVGGISVRI